MTYDMDELTMSHVSTNFDRSGFYQDVNTSFPIDRLRELARRRRDRIGCRPSFLVHGGNTADGDGADRP